MTRLTLLLTLSIAALPLTDRGMRRSGISGRDETEYLRIDEAALVRVSPITSDRPDTGERVAEEILYDRIDGRLPSDPVEGALFIDMIDPEYGSIRPA
jgi:hypothetical protein